ncbi:MAG: tetratricopeptide repeat protein [Waddliaceae bacterium]
MHSVLFHCFFYYFLVVISLLSHELRGSTPPNPTEKQADHFFQATLFEQSIPLYEQALSTLDVETEERARIRFHLAQAYFFSGRYAKIPEILSGIDGAIVDSSSQINTFRAEAIYLLGLAYQKIKQHDLAIAKLQEYLSLEDNMALTNKEEAEFELGLAYFYAGKGECAKNQWKAFSETSQNKRLFVLSKIYLVRLALVEGDFSQAESFLNFLSDHIDWDDNLHYALSFLWGEMFFQQQQWQNALVHFAQAIPSKNQEKAEWYPDALYHLGCCHLNLGDRTQSSLENQRDHLNNAEKTLLKLLETSPSDRAYLALGRCYLAKNSRLHEEHAGEECIRLLSSRSLWETGDAHYQALLLMAEASSSFSERKRLFRQLTHESHWDCPHYGNAWYLQGLNEFDAAQRAKEQKERHDHLDLAINSLQQAFDLFYPGDKRLAALALKYRIHAHQLFDYREGYLTSLSLLSRLLNSYRHSLFSLLEDPDEIYFLQGFAASHLVEGDEEMTFFEIGENSLNHAVESYPNGKYFPQSLELLGTLYFQQGYFEEAEEIFLRLAHLPSSSAGEAWYWASRSVESQGKDEPRRKQYIKRVYESFPQSPHADEAYFRYYSYGEYVAGKPEAIAHLKSLEAAFPRSLYRLYAHYLLGLHARQHSRPMYLSQAIKEFQEAETVFHLLFDEGRCPQERLHDLMAIRYRAMLEKGLTYFALSRESDGAKKRIYLEHAEEVFVRMYSDAQDPGHFLAAEGSSLREEGSFSLAACYLEVNKDEAAEEVLARMLEHYHSANAARGYYLSRVWYEHGCIALRRREYALAIDYFKHADDAGKGKVLSTDELLDLWIQESLCYQGLQRLDEAMLLLSRVINYHAISGQRLKAMYLRAEIYEKQERYELAKLQLEATAKKGGEWSLKAKEKLEERYAYR